MKLKILTYNIAMLPDPLGSFKDERAAEFINLISKTSPAYDFICFQEVFDECIREFLQKQLQPMYPYIIEKSSDHDLLNQDSGLFFASKFPILSHTFREYNAKQFLTGDWISDKGILIARIDIGQNEKKQILHIYVTHLQSTEAFYKVREKQLAQLGQTIIKALETERKKEVDWPTCVVLVGDFNVIGGSEEYKRMMSLLGYPRDLFYEKNPEDYGYTWNSHENLYIHHTAEDDHDMQRLDYILTFNSIPYADDNCEEIIPLRKVDCKACNIVTARSTDYIKCIPPGFDLSDHYGLEAIIEIG